MGMYLYYAYIFLARMSSNYKYLDLCHTGTSDRTRRTARIFCRLCFGSVLCELYKLFFFVYLISVLFFTFSTKVVAFDLLDNYSMYYF